MKSEAMEEQLKGLPWVLKVTKWHPDYKKLVALKGLMTTELSTKDLFVMLL